MLDRVTVVASSLLAAVSFGLGGCAAARTPTALPPPGDRAIRVASFNASLNDDRPGGLIARLAAGDAAAAKIAAVIQTVRPDVLLLAEFDHDPDGEAATRFVRDYLGRGQHGRTAIDFPHRFAAPSNTGEPSGFDLDGNGRIGGPGDAWGYGQHPGQFAMLVLSRFPIDVANARTFRLLPWSAMPGARAPKRPDGSPWYSDAAWTQMRLSSKSHWDLPVATPLAPLHLLASHPTPPVFDGPENRNGTRNYDEVRFWADYLTPARAGWIVDDAGRRGGLDPRAPFVVVGDLNADPLDGESLPGTMRQLLGHPRVRAVPAPASRGGTAAARRDGGPNAAHRTDPRLDTAAFATAVGNLRVDYVLPSTDWAIRASGVFWPRPGEPGAELLDVSDHRLVWVDLEPAGAPAP